MFTNVLTLLTCIYGIYSAISAFRRARARYVLFYLGFWLFLLASLFLRHNVLMVGAAGSLVTYLFLRNRIMNKPLEQLRKVEREEALKTLFNKELMEWSELIYAIKSDNEAKTRKLIEKGEDINTKDMIGMTPLMHAVANDSLAISRLLVEKGADIYSQDEMGMSSLHHACEAGSYNLTKFFLGLKIDPNMRSFQDETPLMSLAKSRNPNIVDLLIESGAAPKLKDVSGRNALMHAAMEGNGVIAGELIKCGVDMNSRDLAGKSALIYAVEGSFSELARTLLKAGADYNAVDNSGRSVLHYALDSKPEEFSFLLEYDVDTNVLDESAYCSVDLSNEPYVGGLVVKEKDSEMIKLVFPVTGHDAEQVLTAMKRTVVNALERYAGNDEFSGTIQFIINEETLPDNGHMSSKLTSIERELANIASEVSADLSFTRPVKISVQYGLE